MAKKYDVTLIRGDGIGPEVIDAAVACIRAAGVKINWDIQEAGEKALSKHGTPIPDKVIESIKNNGVALKGPVTTPVGEGFRSVNVKLRQSLNLFANVRPIRNYPGIESNYKKVNLVIIRENTEDLYSGIEFEKGADDTEILRELVRESRKMQVSNDSAVSLKVISEHASDRIMDFAFNYALANDMTKVTVVHKANILKFTDGLFLESARRASRRYPGINFEDRIVDNMSMQLVQSPQEFQIIVAPNLYGDILSDLCAGLVGGLGLAPSANFGDRCALFEPVHGSAPKYAGKDKVNPGAAILSAVMMLNHLGETKAAKLIENSLMKVLKERKFVTYDIAKDKPVGTKRMTKEVVKLIEKSYG